ncbi:MAG: DUF4290 domain-containing protein [Saprospiraceae bacterium]|nr:DUF4290 domain-containing protein [Saprospiraceae bacterium]MDW8483436.1 DUF4290 domain-containing protein [Saprospiraceae bacterium]
MNSLKTRYNTEKEEIRFAEYGRLIQDLLLYAKKIEDPQQRQRAVESIVGMMQMLHPAANRNSEDYREKLWNHAFAIAGYDLDVTPPPGVTIRPQAERPKPERIPYPVSTARFRHYGQNVQRLIQKAIAMPEGPKKEALVEVIASYMKLAYKTWNREHYVSDDIIKDDLEILSEGRLRLHEGHSSLDILASSVKKDAPSANGPGRSKRKGNGRLRRRNGNFRKRKK